MISSFQNQNNQFCHPRLHFKDLSGNTASPIRCALTWEWHRWIYSDINMHIVALLDALWFYKIHTNISLARQCLMCPQGTLLEMTWKTLPYFNDRCCVFGTSTMALNLNICSYLWCCCVILQCQHDACYSFSKINLWSRMASFLSCFGAQFCSVVPAKRDGDPRNLVLNYYKGGENIHSGVQPDFN